VNTIYITQPPNIVTQHKCLQAFVIICLKYKILNNWPNTTGILNAAYKDSSDILNPFIFNNPITNDHLSGLRHIYNSPHTGLGNLKISTVTDVRRKGQKKMGYESVYFRKGSPSFRLTCFL
jgi:hypothetical protein